MSHRLSQNARHTHDLLEELERDKELEILREYLTRFDLFPRQRDPAAAPIRFEELKELVKHWKLHRQRNFWKTHTTKEDLVRTLYRHINTRIIPQEASSSLSTREEGSAISGSGGNPNSSVTSPTGGAANVAGGSAPTNNGQLQPQPPPSHASGGGGAVPMAPTAPARKASIHTVGAAESPRSKSILVHARGSPRNSPRSSGGSGPNSEHIFAEYSGDLFSQRGDYEDGMIYLSRFQKPGGVDAASDDGDKKNKPGDSSSSDLQALNADDEESHAASHDDLDVASAFVREVRLKQECAFSIYHFTTDVGHETQMVNEGCMLALSRLAVFDDMDVKKFCAAAILNLTCEPTLCVRMLDDGVLLALLELAKAQHEEIRRNTSLALCRFSYDRSGQLRLVQEGCVSAIISMLNSPDAATKEACVKALVNIASCAGTAVAESVVHTIVKLSATKEPARAAFAAEAICNLSLLTGPRGKVVEDGILDNVCELTQSSSSTNSSSSSDATTVKLDVATALANFSGCACNLELLSQVRVLECLEDLLKCEHDVVRERCAFTIANLSSHATSLKNLVLSDAVEQLVEIGASATANRAVQESIALSLSNMSATPESRPLLARFGVVSLLLRYLDNDLVDASTADTSGDSASSARTKQYAIVALCSLMTNAATCSELMQNNTPAVLARLATTSLDKVRELCATALFNLSCDMSLHSYLLKDDVIPAIARLCKRFVVGPDGVEVELDVDAKPPPGDKSAVLPVVLLRSQECALACLFNLSFCDESRKVLLHVDVVKTLVQLFARPPGKSTSDEVPLKQAAAILANLSFDAEAHARMIDDGCMRLLRRLMTGATSKDTLQCCATACCNLAVDALEKATPVLAMLIDLSSSPHATTTLTCAIAFAKLASIATCRPALTKCAELYPALTLMMRCGIEDIQIYSAVTLCNLAAVERNSNTSNNTNPRLALSTPSASTLSSRHIWREGTVPDFIVNALLRINSDSTKEICARALYNLLTHDELRAAHIKDGCLYALVKLARLESVEIRSLCVAVLYNLSCDAAMLDTLLEINVAQVITKMCEMEFSSQDIHRRLAACLMNIASRPGHEVRLVESGALLATLVLAEHNDPLTMRYCASVLCYLSATRSNCEAMVASGLVDVLVRMLTADDSEQNVFALHALCNISCVPTLHDRVVHEDVSREGDGNSGGGAIAATLHLFAASDDESVLLGCAKTLYNLTHHVRIRRLLLERELLDVLQRVFARQRFPLAPLVDAGAISSPSPSMPLLLDVCVQIIAILCEEAQDWSAIVANGAVRVLRDVAPHCTDATTMLHAVYALSQLVRCDQAGLTLLNDGGLDVLASAVLPLPVAAMDADTGVTAKEAVVQTPTTRDVSPELAERCVIILRSLSTSLECLPLLVADARLVPIVRAITTASGASRDTSRHAILTLYNIVTASSKAAANATTAAATTATTLPLDTLVANGVIRVLIRLSTVGGVDMAPICAIALAHIKNIQGHLLVPGTSTTVNESDASPPDEMDDGIVTTLLSMIDLDQPSIQRIDRLAAALPANLPPLRPSEWRFLAGDTSIRLGAQLPVSWAVHTSSIDDARLVPAELRTFMSLLAPVVPATGVAVQDKLVGAFRTMRVRDDKFRLKRVDPRLVVLQINAMATATSAHASLSDAIALAIGDESGGGDLDPDHRAPTPSSPTGWDDTDTATGGRTGSDSDNECDVRAPSPVKKKKSSNAMRALVARSTSAARNIGSMDRRSSKSNNIGGTGIVVGGGGGGSSSLHKGSKAHLQDTTSGSSRPELSLRKKESQRNSKLYGDAERVVLPKL